MASSSPPKSVNGVNPPVSDVVEKPTKYDIIIKDTDKKIPFSLEKMPGRPVGARLCKIYDPQYNSIATPADILVAIDKTVVLKLGVHNIDLMLKDLRHAQKGNNKPIVCRFVNSNAAKNRQKKRNEQQKQFVSRVNEWPNCFLRL